MNYIELRIFGVERALKIKDFNIFTKLETNKDSIELLIGLKMCIKNQSFKLINHKAMEKNKATCTKMPSISFFTSEQKHHLKRTRPVT